MQSWILEWFGVDIAEETDLQALATKLYSSMEATKIKIELERAFEQPPRGRKKKTPNDIFRQLKTALRKLDEIPADRRAYVRDVLSSQLGIDIAESADYDALASKLFDSMGELGSKSWEDRWLVDPTVPAGRGRPAARSVKRRSSEIEEEDEGDDARSRSAGISQPSSALNSGRSCLELAVCTGRAACRASRQTDSVAHGRRLRRSRGRSWRGKAHAEGPTAPDPDSQGGEKNMELWWPGFWSFVKAGKPDIQRTEQLAGILNREKKNAKEALATIVSDLKHAAEQSDADLRRELIDNQTKYNQLIGIEYDNKKFQNLVDKKFVKNALDTINKCSELPDEKADTMNKLTEIVRQNQELEENLLGLTNEQQRREEEAVRKVADPSWVQLPDGKWKPVWDDAIQKNPEQFKKLAMLAKQERLKLMNPTLDLQKKIYAARQALYANEGLALNCPPGSNNEVLSAKDVRRLARFFKTKVGVREGMEFLLLDQKRVAGEPLGQEEESRLQALSASQPGRPSISELVTLSDDEERYLMDAEPEWEEREFDRLVKLYKFGTETIIGKDGNEVQNERLITDAEERQLNELSIKRLSAGAEMQSAIDELEKKEAYANLNAQKEEYERRVRDGDFPLYRLPDGSEDVAKRDKYALNLRKVQNSGTKSIEGAWTWGTEEEVRRWAGLRGAEGKYLTFSEEEKTELQLQRLRKIRQSLQNRLHFPHLPEDTPLEPRIPGTLDYELKSARDRLEQAIAAVDRAKRVARAAAGAAAAAPGAAEEALEAAKQNRSKLEKEVKALIEKVDQEKSSYYRANQAPLGHAGLKDAKLKFSGAWERDEQGRIIRDPKGNASLKGVKDPERDSNGDVVKDANGNVVNVEFGDDERGWRQLVGAPSLSKDGPWGKGYFATEEEPSQKVRQNLREGIRNALKNNPSLRFRTQQGQQVNRPVNDRDIKNFGGGNVTTDQWNKLKTDARKLDELELPIDLETEDLEEQKLMVAFNDAAKNMRDAVVNGNYGPFIKNAYLYFLQNYAFPDPDAPPTFTKKSNDGKRELLLVGGVFHPEERSKAGVYGATSEFAPEEFKSSRVVPPDPLVWDGEDLGDFPEWKGPLDADRSPSELEELRKALGPALPLVRMSPWVRSRMRARARFEELGPRSKSDWGQKLRTTIA